MPKFPTAWQQFRNSGFKYRPVPKLVEGFKPDDSSKVAWRVSFKTNKAKWAAQ